MVTKKAIVIFILVMIFSLGAELFAQLENKILFTIRLDWIDNVLGDQADMYHVWTLEDAGYDVVTWDINTALSTADPATIDSLNSASLIIMGRSTPSTQYQDPNKEPWNDITAPILNIELWNCRNSRLNWFNSTAMANINDDVPYEAIIDKPDDPVFDGIDVSGPVYWTDGPISVLQETTAGNGTVLARMEEDSSVLFVRFEPDVEFYEGSGDMPAGPRSMIGNGNDDTTDPGTGDKFFNFYNFTEESEQVFLNEVARMFALGGGTPVKDSKKMTRPSTYVLSQNYPNPFNPTTQIDFSLLRPSHTTVQVFNATGQLIETLVDQKFTEGTHTIQFRADNLSAGVYFYKINTDNFSDIKKMVLLK